MKRFIMYGCAVVVPFSGTLAYFWYIMLRTMKRMHRG